MNDHRLQSYLGLIDTLLSCSDGEVLEILLANKDLLDANLIDTLSQIAVVGLTR